MARIPIVKDGVVVNLVELEPGADWQPPEGGYALGPAGGNIGDAWDGAAYAKPAPVVVPAVEKVPTPEERIAELEKRLALLEGKGG